jgi:hypothetical protein
MIALLWLAAAGFAAFGAIIAGRVAAARSWRAALVAYTLRLPRELAADDVAAWLSHVVSGTQAPRFRLLTPPPVALEVVATAAGIRHVLLVPERTRGTVLAGLRAAMPAVRFEQADDYWAGRPRVLLAAEARLTSLTRPLAHERAERASSALLASLSPLGAGEVVVLQWLFVGATRTTLATARSGTAEALATLLGDTSTGKDAEALAAERRKQAEPMLAAVLRLGVAAPTRPERQACLVGCEAACGG